MRSHKSNSALQVSRSDESLKPAIREAASLLRRYRLSYDQAQYVLKAARKQVGLARPTAPQKLPKALSPEEVERLFSAIRKAGNVEHELLFRLVLATGLRCAEMTNVLRSDVSLEESTIRVTRGKGGKDRIVLFPTSLRMPIELHLRATPEQRWLFETRQRKKYSTRWIQELSVRYGGAAGLENFHVHLLRHTCLTRLAVGVRTGEGARIKLSDAQIQVQSGHSQRSSLEVYARLGLGELRDDYETIMNDPD